MVRKRTLRFRARHDCGNGMVCDINPSFIVDCLYRKAKLNNIEVIKYDIKPAFYESKIVLRGTKQNYLNFVHDFLAVMGSDIRDIRI